MDNEEQAKAYIAQMMQAAEELTRELGLPAEAKFDVLRRVYADLLPPATAEEDDEERKLSYYLLDMEEQLCERIIAQVEAIEQVSNALYYCLSGLKDSTNCLASFLFLGPSGVGKTELAKILAKLLFGNDSAFFETSLQTETTLDWIMFIDHLKDEYVADPRASKVFVFEEIEKASSDALNRLLQIIQDGQLTLEDDEGYRVVDFRNSIIIMNSCIGADLFAEEARIRFRQSKAMVETRHTTYEATKNKVLDLLKNALKPEFLNCIDEVVFFQPLSREDASALIERMLARLRAKLTEHQIELIMPQTVKDHLLEKHFDPRSGAHSLPRAFKLFIEDYLVESLITEKFRPGDQVEASINDDELVLQTLSKQPLPLSLRGQAFTAETYILMGQEEGQETTPGGEHLQKHPNQSSDREGGKAPGTRPLIGIPCHSGFQAGTWKATYMNNQAYMRAVEEAGGVPVFLPILVFDDVNGVEIVLSHLDGLLLPGGPDVQPHLYGEEQHPLTMVAPVVDEIEFTLVRLALKKDLPILGISRGMQLLNVALGGSLYQDLPSQYPDSLKHMYHTLPRAHIAHAVYVEPGSRMAEVLGTHEVWVNSRHHQAIKVPGKGVRISGRAADGVAEMFEVPGYRFVFAVQCNPEDIYTHEPAFARLFSAFIKAASTSTLERVEDEMPTTEVARLLWLTPDTVTKNARFWQITV